MRGNAPETLKKLAGSLVLCLGDLMLDRFIYGTATRLSPEAPVPVVAVRRRCCMPGGLGNVVMNLAALGARPLAVGLTGRDRHAQVLSELLAPALDPLSPPLLEDPDRPTTVKTRIIAGIQQVARLDEESEEPLPADLDRLYRQAAEALLPLAGATVASDYGKGVLSPDFCAWLMARAKELNSPVVVDPKGPDYSRYAGAWLVTPNRQELSQAVGRDLSRGSTEDLAAAGRELMARHRLSNVLITRSEDGMTLVPSDGRLTHFPTRARAVYDVSGAGDTVAAVMAATLAAGGSLEDGAELATLAAGVVVGKVGTATAGPEEIAAYLEAVEADRPRP